jgi:hypothetical protein
MLLAATLLLALGCGLKGMLTPRDKLPNEETGTPIELRLYPARQTPADALGVSDMMQSPSNPGAILERSLTPTPTPTPTRRTRTPTPAAVPAPSPTPTEVPE